MRRPIARDQNQRKRSTDSQVANWANGYPLFTPLSMNPNLWLDASDTTTITESSGLVSQWNDKSGNGYTFTQGVGANQPTTGSITLNGKNVLSFDGNDFMSNTAASSVWNFMHDGTINIIAMVWRTTDANPNALYALLSTARINAADRGFVLCYEDRASVSRNDRMLYYVVNGSTPVPVDGVISSDNAFPAAKWGITTTFIDPGNATAANRAFVYTDSSLVSGTEINTSTPSTANASATFQIGRNGTLTSFVPKIYLAEVVILSGPNATNNNRIKLFQYLKTKWGL